MNKEFDIAIVGSGITGSTLAILLSRLTTNPSRVALIQKIDLDSDLIKKKHKPDVLALSYDSKLLLKGINAWPEGSSVIKTVHVSKFNQFGKLLLKNTDLNIDELGSIVNYDNLQKKLDKLVLESGVSLICGDNVEIIKKNSIYQTQIDGSFLKSLIVIQANGINCSDFEKKYDQKALLTTVKVRSHNNEERLAWERFTDTGCIALLPTPQNLDLYSVVWCDNIKNIECLINMSNKEFSISINKFFGSLLGNISSDFERYTIPLSLKIKKHLNDLNLVTIGNAAQTIHPIGGQGLNLGLRDVGCLVRCIDKWLDNKTETISILNKFNNKRYLDRIITIGITDTLTNIFSSKIHLIQKMFGTSLSLIDLIKPLKRSIIRQLIIGTKM
ncbi:2-octaprenyl-6-methoxyphenol hydroxylase [Candidatus Kinetoplastibacterium oncopeltii TCC290E]|uniref:2-octaprenyl-6-methoxyphenol hydroxylase n=1 Tax=Candidatus Kinetoplastidibacterium stringomonadis TCC290E TaxID=1208920 RepID=M1LSJ1_9PROT|nr:2-octaprenyl-6-methoxyphenol hydroxylase [Candidatus Kinetoplastibacterium oncopeltii]AGF48522.1 2-octaprenyl-6-methoxyphenol hydroxylase [Candidatus Kinetoplastibacterium oncopeltii TCC290E]